MAHGAATKPDQQPPLVLSEADMLNDERTFLDPEQKQLVFSALCLSGGGIRSAAFSLGVLQALEKRSLLHDFDYLSTVSGGGYIGSWLTRAIAQPPNHGKKLNEILEAVLRRKNGSDSPELSHLRRYTSFLTPDPGAASMDTWAGILLWMRNTLINWMVFFPLMLAVAALPIAYLAALCAFAGSAHPAASGDPLPSFLAVAAGALALLCLGWGVYWSCVDLPSHSHPDRPGTKSYEAAQRVGKAGRNTNQIAHWIVWPVWCWALLAPLAVAPIMQAPEPLGGARAALISPDCPYLIADLPPAPVTRTATQIQGEPSHPAFWRIALTWLSAHPLLWLPAGSVIVPLLAFGVAWRTVTKPKAYGTGDATEAEKERNRRLHRRAFKLNVPGWIAGCATSASLLTLGLYLAQGRTILWLCCAGPLWVIITDTIRSTVYIALRIEGLRSDLDREWLARLSAAKLRGIVVVGAVGTATLYLPILILDHRDTVWKWLVAVIGLLAGPTAAFIGKSASTLFSTHESATQKKAWIRPDLAVSIGVAIFAISLLMLLGRLTALAGFGLIDLAAITGWRPDTAPSWQFVQLFVSTCGLAILAVSMALLVDWRIDLNNFSMHAVYRNRLVRAFLGSACAENSATALSAHARLPDAFTGFDPNDDIRVADVLDRGKEADGNKRPPRKKLFPVINVAMNVTTGHDTARSERKAEPFTITPLHCGAASFNRPRAEAPRHGAYVPTEIYAGQGRESGPDDEQKGMTLGTAMTVSGAAISPNMGYQSSAAGAFVMTLFNVRLGVWLPNPNVPEPDPSHYDKSLSDTKTRLNKSGPSLALRTLLDELAGRSDSESAYIYLSDGGHFDNLGVYEMFRRRCGLILVVDAGRDEHYAYRDLGRALQRILVDRGVEVNFVKAITIGDASLQQSGAFAEIRYPDSSQGPATTGKLIYLKPYLPANAPTELQAFKALKTSFPHETTADQFFTESDFESYRRLGEYLLDEMLAGAMEHSDKDTLLRTERLSLQCIFSGVERSTRS